MSVYVAYSPSDMCTTLKSRIFDRLVFSNGKTTFHIPINSENSDKVKSLFDTFLSESSEEYKTHYRDIRAFNVTADAYAGDIHILTGIWTIRPLAPR